MTIEETIQTAIQKWDLSNIKEEYRYCNRLVCFATSEKYGEVVLKINANENDLHHEYRALKELQGDFVCRAYAYDAAGHMLLEERILPGTGLRGIEDIDRRLNYFAAVFKNIHHQASNEYATYMDWLGEAYAYCCDNEVSMPLKEKMARALAIGKEMFEKYPERMLLHGDLHHDNILCDLKGQYKIIDPKGVIGPAILDVPRFVMNELDPDINKTGAEHIRYVIGSLSRILGYEEEDIRKLFFMEVNLGNVWCLQDGEEVEEHDINIAAEILTDECEKNF